MNKLKTVFTKKRLVLLVCLVAVVVAVYAFMSTRANAEQSTSSSFLEGSAQRQDIGVTLSATGTVQPANQYSVTSNLSGEVIESYFEEGDMVEEGQILYEIDSSDALNSIERAQLSLEKQQLSYQETVNDYNETQANLSVKSTGTGSVISVHVKVGDEINNGAQVATIRDSSVMKLRVPFNSYDVDSFYVGQSATVTIEGSFESLQGSISEISALEEVLSGYQIVRYVTITVNNPGGLSTSTVATASVGDAMSNASASFTTDEDTIIYAKTSGTVQTLYISEGTSVREGDVVAQLSSSSSSNSSTQIENAQLSLRDSQLSYENTVSQLNDYTITAPIAGTVVTKNTKKGDNLSSSGQTTLAVIYDLSYLTFDISLDELDISQVSVGQTVSITCDAISSGSFSGIVTKVSVAGSTQNGVTSYPVTVQIDDVPDGLLPGMNVEASIVISSSENALVIPSSALQRGNIVYVKDTSVTNTEGTKLNGETLPDGWKAVQVETGISDDNYVEILSGISEGDTVLVTMTQSTTSDWGTGMEFSIGGGMPAGGGDMSGGGMPAGGGNMGGGGFPG